MRRCVSSSNTPRVFRADAFVLSRASPSFLTALRSYSMSNGENNWNVGYGAIVFMEQVLNSHTAVESFERINDIRFLIQRRNEMSGVNAVLVEQYEFGIAAFYAVLKEFDG